VGGKAGVVEQDWYNWTSQSISSLSVLEYLNWDTSTEGSPATFNTFLKAIEAAGLNDMLTNEGPFIVYAPTDAAFAKLPKDQLDALLADPQALADLVRYHISEGYYPWGNVPGSLSPDLKVTLTNLLGSEFKLIGDGTINGIGVERLDNLMVKNGTRLTALDTVLMPPKP
jgi:uncharacterized surface protein with fasciclin (FAS1) repeats